MKNPCMVDGGSKNHYPRSFVIKQCKEKIRTPSTEGGITNK